MATNFPFPKGYIISLSRAMVVALVDIDIGYTKDDSPSLWTRTVEALRRRGLVVGFDKKTHLTTAGRAALHWALHERKKGKAKGPRSHLSKPAKRTKAAEAA